MPAGPCTGAQRRKLPTGHSSLADRRGTSPPQVFETQGAVGGSRRPARLHEINRAKSFRKVQGGTYPFWRGLDHAGSSGFTIPLTLTLPTVAKTLHPGVDRVIVRVRGLVYDGSLGGQREGV